MGSKEFKPRDVKAIVENMMLGTLHHNFTVGITDDVTNLSLKTDPAFANDDAGYNSAILYGIGSDGTVGAVKNIVKIVGENLICIRNLMQFMIPKIWWLDRLRICDSHRITFGRNTWSNTRISFLFLTLQLRKDLMFSAD